MSYGNLGRRYYDRLTWWIRDDRDNIKAFLVIFAVSEQHKIDSTPNVSLLLPPPPIAAAHNAKSHPFHRPLEA
jgi:hypothetical protein